MSMKPIELIKKLGKLLGKKETTAATIQAPPIEQPEPIRPLDKLGVTPHAHLFDLATAVLEHVRRLRTWKYTTTNLTRIRPEEQPSG